MQRTDNILPEKLGKELSFGIWSCRLPTWLCSCANGGFKDYLGDLNKVKRIVKVLGMVNSVDTFTINLKVVLMDFSDLLVEVLFGEKGKHARSAGIAALPRLNASRRRR